MKLNQDYRAGSYLIRSYRPGQLTINDELLTRSVVVAPATLLRDWPPQAAAELTVGHMQCIIELEPEVLLLGTGERQQFPDPALLKALITQGIGVEVMGTAAACRTYNLLTNEGRRVAAGLLLR